MDDLIKALQIFQKYSSPNYPTSCEHDVLYVHIKYDKVSQEDKDKLVVLGFEENEEDNGFLSYTFGSA